MENSTLNLAHEKQRRADSFLRQGRFEAAAECYERVANLLSEAHGQMKTSLTNSQSSSTLPPSNLPPVIPSVQSIMTLESLALQSDYHRRQAAVVRMKQAQYEEYKNVLENEQRVNKQISKQHSKNHHVDGGCESADCALRQAIYKTIEEQDSLLSLISLPENDDKNFKHPKDTTTVIEELRTINCTLRGLLGNLINNLEEKEEEIRQLNERLNTLLAINTNDESKASDAHPRRLAPLPPLAPLEMPVFDFTSS